MPILADDHDSRPARRTPRGLWLLAVPLLALVVLGVRPLEVWLGGNALFVGGRYFAEIDQWRPSSGWFRSPGKVRRYLGVERGVFVGLGPYYYCLSVYIGRPVSIGPNEDVPQALYTPGE